MPSYIVMYRPDTWPTANEAPVMVDLTEFRNVGRVGAADLEALFDDMQAVRGAETCCRLRVRPMSVGDVVIEEATGEAWYCAPVGWLPVQTRGEHP